MPVDQTIVTQFVDLSLAALHMPDCDFFYTEAEKVTDKRFLDQSRPVIGKKVPWKAVDSLITEAEIRNTEQVLQLRFPPSFITYLRYKNFYELSLGLVSDVWMFCPLIPGEWSRRLEQEAFAGWPREYLYDCGLVPFANYSDWGLACFNTQKVDADGEYEIVLWDHEKPEEWSVLAPNLVALFAEIIQAAQRLATEE